MHCGRFQPAPLTRRQMLRQSAGGFGALAFAGLCGQSGLAVPTDAPEKPLTSSLDLPRPHHAPRAKNVIFLFMDGGPSQVDTFDPKPLLDKEHGQPIKMKVQPTQFDNNGNVLRSPWKFNQYGESGLPVSDLFPQVATCADDLCVIRSMVANFSEHTNANYFLHSGFGLQGRPSMGAWATYGLGSENQDLPGFVVLNCGMIPPGGIDCFSNGFLPATNQGSIFQHGEKPLPNLQPPGGDRTRGKRTLDLVRQLDQELLAKTGANDKIESAIANGEMAFRMQAAVPDLSDISQETQATKKLYGLDAEYGPTRIYGKQCLLARRLVERGVRFVEVLCPAVGGDRWDQHANIKEGHANNARATDQPIAALLKDLKSRGLLEETLVIWGGEFGRTPFSQGSDGRDHNPYGFSMWMAGGGAKGGYIHGATDEYGYHAIEDKVEVHDLHATMLHLLGMDHWDLTYRFGGRDMRLTDVHGNVVNALVDG